MLDKYVHKILQNKQLTESECFSAMRLITESDIPDALLSVFMSVLHFRGETVEELKGILSYFSSKTIPFNNIEKNVIDICGTGGDDSETFNVSTASALLAASCGLSVAKHGGRSVSSHCGSADVLEMLGINLYDKSDLVVKDINEINFAFLYAPNFNLAFNKVRELRKILKIRTCFNLLGPLLNPLHVKRQLIGVYDKKYLHLIAELMHAMGSVDVMVIHARDGLDEISISAPTDVVHLQQGTIKSYVIYPDKLGFFPASKAELKGGNSQENANIIRRIFAGQQGAARDITLLNTAAALVVGGVVGAIEDGIKTAAYAIDCGNAQYFLDKLIKRHEEMKNE